MRDWQVVERQDQRLVHVLPLGDLKPHVEEADCDCEPELEIMIDYLADLMVHNSYDKRELH